MARRLVLALLCTAGCSSDGVMTQSDAGPVDAAVVVDQAVTDAALTALTPCSAKIQPLGDCWAITPSETGADPNGENAAFPSEALPPAPGTTPRNQLVIFLNGSGGHPGPVASPTVNFYNTAASLGYHVLALSYRSSQEVDSALCHIQDACFFPTRQTIILGKVQPQSGLTTIRLDEGITDRLFLALRYLAAHDATWSQFLVGDDASAIPDTQIAWPKIVVSGHSQGGGHAAAMGKLFPVARVLQFSSPCDATGYTTAATWTNGSTGIWASDPKNFYGLGVMTVFTAGKPTGGDTTCAAHAAVWQNLGMMPSRSVDNASTCGGTVEPHGATIYCADNAPAWSAALQ